MAGCVHVDGKVQRRQCIQVNQYHAMFTVQQYAQYLFGLSFWFKFRPNAGLHPTTRRNTCPKYSEKNERQKLDDVPLVVVFNVEQHEVIVAERIE